MYKRILVPVDGSTTSNLALDEAIGLANGRQSRLRVVHVIDTINLNVDSMTDITGPMRESDRKILHESESRARRARVKVETGLLEIQKLAERISDLVVKDAATWRADTLEKSSSTGIHPISSEQIAPRMQGFATVPNRAQQSRAKVEHRCRPIDST